MFVTSSSSRTKHCEAMRRSGTSKRMQPGPLCGYGGFVGLSTLPFRVSVFSPCHSGRAKRDPESRNHAYSCRYDRCFSWIPDKRYALSGMTLLEDGHGNTRKDTERISATNPTKSTSGMIAFGCYGRVFSSRHSGRAKRDPESRTAGRSCHCGQSFSWIPDSPLRGLPG